MFSSRPNFAANYELSEIQKLVLRMYAKNESISLREIARVIIHPNKTMLGVWVIQFERDGFITRIGSGRNTKVFLTDMGRKAMR